MHHRMHMHTLWIYESFGSTSGERVRLRMTMKHECHLEFSNKIIILKRTITDPGPRIDFLVGFTLGNGNIGVEVHL